MLDFVLASANLPFAIALALMIGIGLLEGVTTLLGAGLSSFIDGALPDLDLDLDVDADLDIDADVDVDIGLDTGGHAVPHGVDLGEVGSPYALSRLLGWLHVGRVPVLALLVLFLLAFGLCGLVVQSVAQNTLGRLLPGWIASIPALFGAGGFVRVAGAGLAKIIPKDETEAVSEESFVGRVAQITLGTASRGRPAQAKLHDQHGRTHYVMVEPDDDGVTFEAGSEVLMIRRVGSRFHAVLNTSDALVDP